MIYSGIGLFIIVFILPVILYLWINAYLVKSGKSIIATVSCGLIMGFLHGFVLWVGFCGSEGLTIFILKELAQVVLLSFIGGILFALVYVIIGLGERGIIHLLLRR